MGLGVNAARKKKKKKKPLSLLSLVFWLLECIEPQSQDREAKGITTIAVVSVISEELQTLFWELEQQSETYKCIKFKKTRDVIWTARENRDSIVF